MGRGNVAVWARHHLRLRHADTPAWVSWVRARAAGDMWVWTSLFTTLQVEHGLSFFIFLPLPSSSSGRAMLLKALWEETSPPVLSVCVLAAPSCSTQLADHGQPRERCSNCAGRRGYAASPSLSTLSASASLSLMRFALRSPLGYCIIMHDITVYIAMTNKYRTLMLDSGNKVHHCCRSLLSCSLERLIV